VEVYINYFKPLNPIVRIVCSTSLTLATEWGVEHTSYLTID